MLGLETILGTITGIGGGLVTGIVNHFTQKQKNKHDLAKTELEMKMMDKEKEFMIAEAQAALESKRVVMEGKMDLADAEVYKTGLAAAQKDSISEKVLTKLLDGNKWAQGVGMFLAFLLGLMDVFKKFMRPGLTTYHVCVTTWITVLAWDIMQAHKVEIAPDVAMNLFIRLSDTAIYLTITCVTWWFFDRRTAKFLNRLDDGNIKK